MVSVISVGASLDDDARGEVGDSGSFADDQVSGGVTQGVDSDDAFASSANAEATADNGATTVADDVNETSTVAANRTSAYIGSGADFDAGNDLNVHTLDRTEIAQNVGGIALSLGGAVGGSVGVVNTNTYNQALIAAGAEVDSGAELVVHAETDNDVHSNALAGAGGLVSIGAAVAIVNDTSVTLAQIENDVVIKQAGSIDVLAEADVDVDTFGYGVVAGAGAVGASIARSNSDSITRALVSDRVQIGQTSTAQVASLNVDAVSDIDADAHAIAGSAGIVSGSGADARSDIDSTTDAQVGASSMVITTGAIDVRARILTQGEARADGVNVAGITVGVSLARADSNPEVNATVGQSTQLNSGQDINVFAGHNVDAAGAELTARKMHARSFSATGALLGGVGSDARATVTPELDVLIEDGASLQAAGQIEVLAQNVARAEADANGQAYGWRCGRYPLLCYGGRKYQHHYRCWCVYAGCGHGRFCISKPLCGCRYNRRQWRRNQCRWNDKCGKHRQHHRNDHWHG